MYAKYFKRVLDFVLSLSALIVLSPVLLVLMAAGGIAGGILGRSLNKKMEEKTVDKLFIGLMVAIILINLYNVFKFS